MDGLQSSCWNEYESMRVVHGLVFHSNAEGNTSVTQDMIEESLLSMDTKKLGDLLNFDLLIPISFSV